MSKSAHLHPSDIRGASRLVVDAIIGIAHVVEAMHGNIAHLPGLPRPAVGASARGITGLVYRSVRQIAGGVGQILDAALARLVPLLGPNDTAPLARLGKIRSAGITDLRYGNLVDEDWEGRDRFAGDGDRRRAIPLPEGVACYAIAGTSARSMGDMGQKILGDGLVTVDSALGRHRIRAGVWTFARRGSGSGPAWDIWN